LDPARGVGRKTSITIYIEERELACSVYLCNHPRSQFTKLFTRDIFIRPCHCSCIFVSCLTFRVQVAGFFCKVYWLRYNIAVRKQNTANKYSQLGRRKKPWSYLVEAP